LTARAVPAEVLRAHTAGAPDQVGVAGRRFRGDARGAGAGAFALEHILDDRATMPAAAGLLLDQT